MGAENNLDPTNGMPTPMLELGQLLSEESLESRFQRVLVSAFRRISDGGYFPARDLLASVEEQGGVAFVRDWLADERAQPSLEFLVQKGRVEIAVEWLVWRVPYCLLFSKEERAMASTNLAAVPENPNSLYRSEGSGGTPSGRIMVGPFATTYFPKWVESPDYQAEWAALALENLATDGEYSQFDLDALQRRRSTDFQSVAPQQVVRQLEEELELGYPFTCSADVFALVRDSQELQLKFPRVTSSVTELHNNLANWIEPDLRVLRPALDLNGEKAELISHEIQRSKAETSMILARRAAMACSIHGLSISHYMDLYFADADSLPYHLPTGFTSYFEPADAQLLNVAMICCTMLPCEQANRYDEVVSFGDIPDSRTWNNKDLGWFDEYSFDPADDVSMEAIILFVQSQVASASWPASQSKQVGGHTAPLMAQNASTARVNDFETLRGGV